MRCSLMFELGRGAEVIRQQKERCELYPNDEQEWILLIEAYIQDRSFDNAYAAFLTSVKKFPESWVLYIHGGDICRELQKYDEAFRYWDKAGELGTDFYDERYCKANCYARMGEYEKAYFAYSELAEILRADHYDVEAEMAERKAKEFKLQIK